MYCVYILQSELDQSYYVGFTSNIDSRLYKHNNAKTGYTSRKKPWKLVYLEEYDSKREAILREKYIKSQKDKSFLVRLIESG